MPCTGYVLSVHVRGEILCSSRETMGQLKRCETSEVRPVYIELRITHISTSISIDAVSLKCIVSLACMSWLRILLVEPISFVGAHPARNGMTTPEQDKCHAISVSDFLLTHTSQCIGALRVQYYISSLPCFTNTHLLPFFHTWSLTELKIPLILGNTIMKIYRYKLIN